MTQTKETRMLISMMKMSTTMIMSIKKDHEKRKRTIGQKVLKRGRKASLVKKEEKLISFSKTRRKKAMILTMDTDTVKDLMCEAFRMLTTMIRIYKEKTKDLDLRNSMKCLSSIKKSIFRKNKDKLWETEE